MVLLSGLEPLCSSQNFEGNHFLVQTGKLDLLGEKSDMNASDKPIPKAGQGPSTCLLLEHRSGREWPQPSKVCAKVLLGLKLHGMSKCTAT
jgi:hypothetical protein